MTRHGSVTGDARKRLELEPWADVRLEAEAAPVAPVSVWRELSARLDPDPTPPPVDPPAD